MEEVDSIIIQFLRQFDLNIPKEIKSLCDLSVEIIVESASKCLTTISPALKLPAKLPPGISHRIEVASQVAAACRDLGYKNDVGYQTFLYYNDAELRQVFMFLIEHLPNEGTQTSGVTEIASSKKSLLMQNIAQKIKEELNSVWIPSCCDPSNRQAFGDNLSERRKLCFNEEDLIHKLSKASLNRELREDIEADVGVDIKEKEINKNIDKSLKELKEMAILLRQKFNSLESEKNLMDIEFQQSQKSCEKAEAELKNVQNILSSIGIDINNADMDNVLVKVQNNIEMLHVKSEQLTSKNLDLKLEIDKLRKSSNLVESERSQCRRALLTLKDSAKSLKDEYNTKEVLRDQLKKKYENIKTGNKRSIYTKRILEIIGNVDKQNIEIKKILMDTRQLQKEINNLEGQLDRCFSIADETLFGDAKKDDQAKKAYKLLALLHSECNTIVSLVNDTGTLAREIVDLEDNIKAEQTKRTEDTLLRIRKDITKMQEESNII